MGKYGKKRVISDDITSYNIGLIGEAGIGKTTVLKEMYEKITGEDGYMFLTVGKEDGDKAIHGIVSEGVDCWKKFMDVVNDIVENKDEEYPDLKVVVVDTYDQLIDIALPEVIRMHNEQNPDKPPIVSIKQAFGGFMAGEDKAVEIIMDALWRLKSVGVAFAIIGHTKMKEKDDPITGQSYTSLTTDITPRYFNAIKNKLDLLGVAHIDREIVRERTGKKNLVTQKEITRGKVRSEERVITFRDDDYCIEGKSRFSRIAGEIPLNADSFIKAIQDAIKAEKDNGTPEEIETIKLVNQITEQAKTLFEKGVDRNAFYAVVEQNCGTKLFNKVKDIEKLRATIDAINNNTWGIA